MDIVEWFHCWWALQSFQLLLKGGLSWGGSRKNRYSGVTEQRTHWKQLFFVLCVEVLPYCTVRFTFIVEKAPLSKCPLFGGVFILSFFVCLVHSFVELSTMLFAVPGVQYILSEKLSQDPIERFFGKQRAAGGRNDNPTVQEFCSNTVSLRLQGSAALEPVRGNCEAKRLSNSLDELSTPLPKRKRLSKSKK